MLCFYFFLFLYFLAAAWHATRLVLANFMFLVIIKMVKIAKFVLCACNAKIFVFFLWSTKQSKWLLNKTEKSKQMKQKCHDSRISSSSSSKRHSLRITFLSLFTQFMNNFSCFMIHQIFYLVLEHSFGFRFFFFC